MKKIFSITIAAVALMTLASCQKENLEAPTVEPAKTVRIISGAFTKDVTKTTLDTDDKTPLWSAGDVIRVLDDTGYEDITLAAANITDGGTKITFTTSLSGMLYAVYPASATSMTSCSDGNITFIVPAVQDGTFGSANICVASGDGKTSNSIYFSNATAVVEITVATNVVGTNFAAANNIAGDMTVSMGNKGAIVTTTPSLSSKTISVSDTKAPAGNKFYIAVAPGETGAVTITCNTSDKSGSTNKSTKTLVKDKIYAMNLSTMTIDTDVDLTGQHGILNGQEYVLIKAQYDGTNDSYLKWATQNLAVTTSGKAQWNNTKYIIGDYFQWAASYAGYGIAEDADKVPTKLLIYNSFKNIGKGDSEDSFSFRDSKQFAVANAPYYSGSGSSYTKYTSGSAKLDLTDDAARTVLGGSWRIPTGGRGGDFQAMYDATTWTWDETDNGYYVTKSGESLSSDKSNALLFFPAAGYGKNALLNVAGYGFYWSSMLSSNASRAYRMYFYSSEVNLMSSDYRYCGCSVRPVAD